MRLASSQACPRPPQSSTLHSLAFPGWGAHCWSPCGSVPALLAEDSHTLVASLFVAFTFPTSEPTRCVHYFCFWHIEESTRRPSRCREQIPRCHSAPGRRCRRPCEARWGPEVLSPPGPTAHLVAQRSWAGRCRGQILGRTSQGPALLSLVLRQREHRHRRVPYVALVHSWASGPPGDGARVNVSPRQLDRKRECSDASQRLRSQRRLWVSLPKFGFY